MSAPAIDLFGEQPDVPTDPVPTFGVGIDALAQETGGWPADVGGERRLGDAVNAAVDQDTLFRARVVGASEVPALFGLSPWLTAFELYHRKRGTIATPEFNARNPDGSPVNSRIHWGVKLERLIVEEACERWGYRPTDRSKVLDNGAGLGGHADMIVWCPERRCEVVLEVKTVDWLERKKWGDEPPSQYLIQPNTYAGLAKVKAFDVIVMVLGGNSDLERFQYDFRPILHAEVEKRVAAFWADVHAGRAPPVDYSRDRETLTVALGEPTEELADLRDNLDAEQDAMDFAAGKALRDQGEAQMEAARTRLLERIGSAGRALLPSYRIGCGMTKGSPDRVAKPGEIIKGRKGYRRFDLKQVEN